MAQVLRGELEVRIRKTYLVVADVNSPQRLVGLGKFRLHRIYCIHILIINYLRNKLLQCFYILQELNDYL